MFQPLLPTLLTEKDSSFSTVKELHEVLQSATKNGRIKNIALTGPFGSGKSSILYTLQENYKDSEYLPISLATLQADEDTDDITGDKRDKSAKNDEEVELLNRKIEYSILQQLIYREASSTVPNSRFRRIVHIGEKKLKLLSGHGVAFILSFLIAFEPAWFRVDSIYQALNFGKWNVVFDVIAVCYMLCVLYAALKYIIKSYSNSKLNKLNLKDGEIELKEENSIFNKHLDEILYFFQVTKYDVVIIEDLDRFGTSKIFLKLRELNQLINESKIVGRNVVFLYAVKDDVFINEERTKFFDYITTVIPVINPSNSKDKLKEALRNRGLADNEIKDGDMADMAFFIQDMRILTNIANEFSQYKEKLLANGQKLNLTKLLAMIVYKNYFPKDFAQLHRREGKIYRCINSKPLFVKGAMEYLSVKEKGIEDDYQLYLQNKHLKEAELRYLYMDAVRCTINECLISIQVEGKYRSLKEIAENCDIFKKFLKLDNFSYTHYYYYSNTTTSNGSIDHKNLENSLGFNKRMEALNSSESTFVRRKAALQREKLSIQSKTIKYLVGKYKQGETDTYKNLGLSEMMDVFIRRGFIDEEYYDYISYFYEGMVSLGDRDLLLSIKRNITQEYTYHIDKIENFVKEFLPYMFESDAILNNDLLNFLAKNGKYNDYFNQVMYRLEKENAPLGFLSQYYVLGKCVDTVFKHYISWDRTKSWQNINTWSNEEESNLLREGWLKFCGEIEGEPVQWLNSNYAFLSERCDSIGIKRCKGIGDYCLFESLDTTNTELLKSVTENSSFSLNAHNLCVIINSRQTEEVVGENDLNLTRVHLASCEELLDYVKDNISTALKIFSDTCKDESADCIRYILNEENLSEEEKEHYLQNQHSRLEDVNGIKKEDYINMAFKLFLINPTWENVTEYYTQETKDNAILYAYIEKYSSELSSLSISEIPDKLIGSLFEELFSTKVLSIDTFKELIRVFNKVFVNCETLATLDAQRLSILLHSGKLPFRDGNTEVLKKTSIYADYLLQNHTEFYAAKDSSYFTSINVAERIISSDLFTTAQKNSLISIIPDYILRGSNILANYVLDVLINSEIKILSEDTLRCLWDNATQLGTRVKALALMIQEFNYDDDQIIELLNVLGDKYTDIAERTKYPTIKYTEWNKALVSCLKDKGFISSYKAEKDAIQIRPKRKK